MVEKQADQTMPKSEAEHAQIYQEAQTIQRDIVLTEEIIKQENNEQKGFADPITEGIAEELPLSDESKLEESSSESTLQTESDESVETQHTGTTVETLDAEQNLADTLEPEEVYEVIISIEDTKKSTVVDTSVEKPQFESMVSKIEVPEEEITLDLIQEKAEENASLEETLVLLARYIETEKPESHPEQNEKLMTALSELSDSLKDDNAENKESQEILSPKVVEKLLIVLQEIGYEHPDKELIKFVQKFNKGFLVDALEYICLAHDSDDSQRVGQYLASRPKSSKRMSTALLDLLFKGSLTTQQG